MSDKKPKKPRKLNHLVIAASHRVNSLNRQLAVHTANQLQTAGDNVLMHEYDFYDMPIYNDKMRINGDLPTNLSKITDALAKVNSLVIATPEYNWSYPASLKNIIDWLSIFRPYPLANKSVLLMSASLSKRGGVVGLTHLRTVFEASGCYVFPQVFPLSEADKLFDDKGKFKNGNEKELLGDMILKYRDYSYKLKTTS